MGETAFQYLGQVHGMASKRKGEENKPGSIQYKSKTLSDYTF
jgi:hypothetical protein